MGRQSESGGAARTEHGDNQFGGRGQQIAEADAVEFLYPEEWPKFCSEKDRRVPGRAESHVGSGKRP